MKRAAERLVTSRLTALTLLVACGSAACGSGADDPWTNGSRLRARIWRSEDGAKAFRAWHDTQRNEDCELKLATDGVLRCLPVWGDLHTFTYFDDASCTSLVVAAHIECPLTATYAGLYVDTAACDPGSGSQGLEVFRIGAALPSRPAMLYQLQSDGTCVAVFTTPPDIVFYDVGPAEDPAGFVAAHTERKANGPIANEWWVADDGARLLTGHAYQSVAAGGLMEVADRFYPPAFGGSYFVGGTCTGEAAACIQDITSCAWAESLPAFAQRWEYDPACGTFERHMFETFSEAEVGAVRDSVSMMCMPYQPSEVDLCVRLGTPVPLETFPAVTEVLLSGDRIRAVYQGVEGGDAVRAAEYVFRDTQFDVDCLVLEAADGRMRCLPYERSVWAEADIYSDAACTTIAAYRHVPSFDEDCLATPPVPALANSWRYATPTGCAGANLDARAYRVGDPIPEGEVTALFVRDVVDACVPFDPAVFPGTVYAVTEIAPSELVAIDDVVE